MTTPGTQPAKKRPTQLGGRPSVAPGTPATEPAATPAAPDRRHEQTPGAGVEGMPEDVAEALGLATVTPADVASPLATKLAAQQASEGHPKKTGQSRARANGGMTLSVSSLMAPALDPEKDLHNPGWRFPRYFTEAVRLLAFTQRLDQQKVAQELLYAGIMGLPPGGVLERVPRELLKSLLQEAYAQATNRAGEQS
jgi:hypothetical protein